MLKRIKWKGEKMVTFEVDVEFTCSQCGFEMELFSDCIMCTNPTCRRPHKVFYKYKK